MEGSNRKKSNSTYRWQILLAKLWTSRGYPTEICRDGDFLEKKKGKLKKQIQYTVYKLCIIFMNFFVFFLFYFMCVLYV